ncbi:MAG TPA: HAD family hydrolase [Anaeromyxobacteraceae bacterium]|nr:HAD family hydrolase [Anaeromyxobacteraceae bacterium]
MPVRAVVTDLDNTLYSWVDYIVPSLESMVASLTATTGLPRIRIVQSLKAVYTRYGSNEYPFAIQKSDLFRPYEQDFDSFSELVIWPAARAFREARRRYLRPYPGVPETLRALKERGVLVVALTDAPRNAVELRLKMLDLDGLFDAVYALRGYELPEEVDPAIRRREAAGHYRTRKTVMVELPKRAEKPSPLGLSRVLSDFSLRPGEVISVGDNVKKDMPAAQACGVLGVWAEYGTYISAEYRERLAIISAKNVTRRHVAEEVADPARWAPASRWPFAISSFTQVLEILEGARWTRPERLEPHRARRRPLRRKGLAAVERSPAEPGQRSVRSSRRGRRVR